MANKVKLVNCLFDQLCTCRCKKNWEGPRCEEPAIDFTKNIENSNEEIVIVAVVISVVIVAIAVMVGCVCWR